MTDPRKPRVRRFLIMPTDAANTLFASGVGEHAGVTVGTHFTEVSLPRWAFDWITRRDRSTLQDDARDVVALVRAVGEDLPDTVFALGGWRAVAALFDEVVP